MAKRRLNDIDTSRDDRNFLPTDRADQAFWDEFWTRETSKNEESSLVTITIKDQETGEEKVLENVRLRFKSVKRLRE